MELKKISDTVWEIDKNFKEGMLVPARIYATEEIVKSLDEEVFEQLTNVATLPGIQKYALALADAHSGYGFPIGGVAAMDLDNGVISPGGIGFDINCSVRLIKTNLKVSEVRPKIKELIDELFKEIPVGVGTKSNIKISKGEFKEMMKEGGVWAVRKGYGSKEDLENTELHGIADYAKIENVSEEAIDRGINELGSIGSGNHYLEIQYIPEGGIFDEKAAKELGFEEGQVFVMFHTGSRGFGHQIASDYIEKLLEKMNKYNIKLRDKELAAVPFNSKEGQEYFGAMGCAVNFSFANHQIIQTKTRQVFEKIFKQDWEKLGMKQVFAIAHNRATIEEINLDNKKVKLLVHRKGATAAYPKNHPKNLSITKKANIGSLALIGGSMETGSYVLHTLESKDTFYSTVHGSGRTMSRAKAKKQIDGKELFEKMMKNGIYVRSSSWAGLAEEAGFAYKNIDVVTEAMEKANISKRLIKLLPLGNIKG
ncbi:MAG: RtcB family protein [Candidatus Rehaiarchaeum fermentans]|nr:RtcB family protein [Candidatus Rehaiarchaeum fermentans]